MHVLWLVPLQNKIEEQLKPPLLSAPSCSFQPMSGLRWEGERASPQCWVLKLCWTAVYRSWPLDALPGALSPASCCICTFTQARAWGICLSVCHSLSLQWLGARRKDKSLGLIINWKCGKKMCVLSCWAGSTGCFMWGLFAVGCPCEGGTLWGYKHSHGVLGVQG